MVDGGTSVFIPLKRSSKPSFKVKVDSPSSDSDSDSHPPFAHSTGLRTPNSTPPTGNTLFERNNSRWRYIDMISPRSSNYERLEGGMGPSRNGGIRSVAWKKFAIVIAVLIGVVYLFGPRGSTPMPWKTVKAPTQEKFNKPPPYIDVDTAPLPGPPEVKKPASAQHPHSYAEDPDPSKTTHCTRPHSSASRLVQYALMIDAGSTGSRIHTYKFNNCGPSPEYEYEIFNMTQPGLSSFSGRPEAAARSLDILLDEAVRFVPKELHSCTPIAVKATAGLRLLGTRESNDILKAVEKRLHDTYPFPLAEKDPVVIMDGKDEGVYAWITANYLLGTIKSDTPKDTPTYAVLDLGGASTQIVFEPTFSSPQKGLEPGEHKYDLKFGGNTHVLYQHSYLGYGLMRARRHVHSLVDFMASIRPASYEEKTQKAIANPCLARSTRRIVELADEKTTTTRKVTMDGYDIGSFEACDRVVQLALAKDTVCEVKPCSFNGVYQPSLLDSFPQGKVLLLSYFYDRLSPLLSTATSSPNELSPKFNVQEIASTARLICEGPETWEKQPWAKDKALMNELRGRPEWCLDLTFMHALLRLGYEFEEKREMFMGKKIGGTELGWCLGATIAMVGGELTCRD